MLGPKVNATTNNMILGYYSLSNIYVICILDIRQILWV